MSRILTPEEELEQARRAARDSQPAADNPNNWSNFGSSGGNFIVKLFGAIFQAFADMWRNGGGGNIGLGGNRNRPRRGSAQVAGVSALQSTADGGGFTPLLNVIQSAESSRSDPYNSFNNQNGGNNLINNVAGTSMTQITVNQLLIEQERRIAAGQFSAAGWPQITHKTLKGMRDADPSIGDELYDADMQTRLAIRLLENSRDFDGFMNGRFVGVEDTSGKRITVTLAANATEEQINQYYRDYITYAIAPEWAGIPRADTGRSFYDGDGINSANVTVQDMVQGLNDTVANIPGYRLYRAAESVGLIAPTNTLDAQGNEVRVEFVERDIKGSDDFARTYLDRYARGLGANHDPTQMRLAQTALKELGYDPGVIDGVWGPNTSSATQAFIAIRDAEINSIGDTYFENNILNDPDPTTDETAEQRGKTAIVDLVSNGRPTNFAQSALLESIMGRSFASAAQGIEIDGVLTDAEWEKAQELSETFSGTVNTAALGPDSAEQGTVELAAATRDEITATDPELAGASRENNGPLVLNRGADRRQP